MISIVIPVLNEASTIVRLLTYLLKNSSEKNISEIIVVDGGSTDSTKDLVTQFSEKNKTVYLFSSKKGRAVQMNIGARNSFGNILYFLHADTFPPKNFDELIINEVNKGNKAGCFRMKFDSHHPVLKVSQWFTRFNFKLCRGGDQSLYVTKEIFNTLNGYNQKYIVYEDCEFINRIYNKYSFKVIDNYVTTSARKYSANGTLKLQYHFALIHLKNIFGVSAENLQTYYTKNIK